MPHHLILGTAGHIDHGKSSLVQALTGSDPDRLPEEKARGVTIELGFAHMTLEKDEQRYELGIVDVPGHADFVNNMVAGVGALDVAIFIVAADDGWMPQSEEHLHILSYLGISNIIIALTKADLCEDIDFTIEVLRDELKDTCIADAPIVPVSSVTGEGIEQLKNAIIDKLQSTQPGEDAGKPRLAIDRIFSPKGTGTVVTGTLTGGSIHVGDTLTLQPLGLNARVRYIQNHNEALETALPGMRTALNLPDLPISSPGKAGAERGHTLAATECGKPTTTLDVSLERMGRTIPGTKIKTLRHMETVMLHHGSSRCQARVILHSQPSLNPGESSLAQLRLEEPMFFQLGDKVVLRDGGQQNTLAGGTILDTRPKRLGFRTEARADFLQPIASSPDDPGTHLLARLQRDYALNGENPISDHPFSKAKMAEIITEFENAGKLLALGPWLIESVWWCSQLKVAQENIIAWHKRHPDLPGMPLDRLAEILPGCSEELFNMIIQQLANNDFKREGKIIASKEHTLTLPDNIKTQAESILQKLDRSGLQPPSPADLCESPEHTQALKYLIRAGQAIELDPKVVISVLSKNHAVELVRDYISKHGPTTASDLRQCLNSTRKVVMPLLEHLDEIGITVRNDNHRTLRE